MKLNDNVYLVLKWIVLIVLPAAAICYAALDGVFGWGQTETVTTVISAVDVFLGTVIGVSTATYNKEVHCNGADQDKAGKQG